MAIVPRKRPTDTPALTEDRYAHLVVRRRVRRPAPPANDADPDAMPAPGPKQAPPPAGAAYEIGYGKPPKDTQFKKGVSGNPKGRPKGAKGLNTIVIKVLTEKVSVRMPDGTQRISKAEALMHKLTEQGFTGNLRAISLALARYASAVPDDVARSPETANEPMDLDEHDLAILEALRASLRDDKD